MIIYLKHKDNDTIKKVKLGFSWAILFFGLWVPVLRKDFKVFMPLFLLSIGIDIVSWISAIGFVFAVFGNILDLGSDFQVGILYIVVGIIVAPFTLLGIDVDSFLMIILSFTGFFIPLYIIIKNSVAFLYNRIYTQELIKNGYYPMTEEDSLILQKKGIKLPSDTNQE